MGIVHSLGSTPSLSLSRKSQNMESALVSSTSSSSSHVFASSSLPRNFTFFLKTSNFKPSPQSIPARLIALSAKSSDSAQFTTPSSDSAETSSETFVVEEEEEEEELKWNVEVGVPNVPPYAVPAGKLTLSDQAFFLLAFIACTTSVAFTSLVVAAVPTLYAMGKAATSLSKLADTAREELPTTMAAVRLSGMEISDLTLELSDLSQEIADGVNKSAQAVRAAEAGIRQIGSLAHHPTVSMIQERASQPIASLQPVVAGAAKKTTRAVGQATKTLMSFIPQVEFNSESREGNGTDRVDT